MSGEDARRNAGAAEAEATLARMGVQRLKDGSLKISPAAARALIEERQRRATMSHVPSTPRMVMREAGGLAVRKGASNIGLGGASHETLRYIRERAPILQSIHAARHAKVLRMAVRWNGKRGDVGWRVVHKDHFEINAKPPKGFEPWIKRFEKVLEAPAPAYKVNTLAAALGVFEDDLLTINRPVTEVLFSAMDPGRIVGFRPVDAALIWPTQLWMEKWVVENPGWYGGWNPHAMTEDDALDLISEKMSLDIRTMDYCLVRDGVVEAAYDDKRLLVAPMANRSSIECNGYYPSCVEMALEICLTFINTWDYNANFFTKGMMSEFILGISGNVHEDDVDAFVDMLREASQGVRRAWQPPVVPLPEGGVLSKIDLKPANREMMYEVFLSLQIALATSVYRMDPSEINAKPWEGSSGPSLNAPNRQFEIELAKAEGLQRDLNHIGDEILTPLARRCHPDLRVVWEWGNYDPLKAAQILETRTRTTITRNEARLEEGLEPMGFWVPSDEVEGLSPEDKEKWENNLWNMPTDATFVGQMAQRQQMAMQAQQQPEDGEQPEDDGFGEPDDPSKDDGFGGQKPTAPFGRPPGQPGGQQPPPAARPPAPKPGLGGGQPQDPMRKGRGSRGRGRLTVYVEDWTE